MMDLEQELRNALKRETPSPDFAARVTARASARPRRWRAVAAAVMLTAVLGGWAVHTVVERREGERAREEVMVALHIASAKVHQAQTQVHDIGRSSR